MTDGCRDHESETVPGRAAIAAPKADGHDHGRLPAKFRRQPAVIIRDVAPQRAARAR